MTTPRRAIAIASAPLVLASLLAVNTHASGATPAAAATKAVVSQVTVKSVKAIAATQATVPLKAIKAALTKQLEASPPRPAHFDPQARTAAAASYHYGPGQWVNNWWTGWRIVKVNGVEYLVACAYRSAGLPGLTKMTPVVTIGTVVLANDGKVVMGKIKSEEMRTVMTHVSRRMSDTMGSATYFAVNEIGGIERSSIKNLAKSAPSATRHEIALLLAESARYHGASTLSLKVTHQAKYVGDLGTVVATITHNPPGKTVKLSASNAILTRAVGRTTSYKVPGSNKLSTSTRVVFTYRSVYAGGSKFTATAAGLVPATLKEGNRTKYQQLMVASSPLVTLRKTTSSSSTFPKAKLASACGTNCDGTHVPVTAHECNPTSAKTGVDYKLVLQNQHGKVLLTKVIAPATCVDVKTAANDRDTVSAWVSSKFKGGWSNSSLVGQVLVDCPGWVDVGVQLICSCKGGGVMVGVNNGVLIKNTLSHSIRLRLDAGPSADKLVVGTWIVVKPGASLTKSDLDKFLTYKAHGKAYAFQVMNGTQRGNGLWRDHAVTPVISIPAAS